MSWLIVAKMPLLMSSRMMSPVVTLSRSASSLTVIVPGSSIGPRSLGSSVWTAPGARPGLRGGLRGPRRPRVPLLLLAIRSSFSRVQCRRGRGGRDAGGCVISGRPEGIGSCGELRREVVRDGRPERMLEGVALAGGGPAVRVPAQVRTPTGGAPGLVEDHRRARCAYDTHELSLGSGGPARDAAARRHRVRRGRPGMTGRRRAYDDTSSDAFLRFFFTGAAGSGASAVPFVLASAAA